MNGKNLERFDGFDDLSESLAARPTKEELVDRNILKTAGNVSDRLVQAQQDLMKKKVEDRLSHLIEERAAPGKVEELVNSNILKGNRKE